ncbi:MAG: hypothetical protein KQH63_20990 [Desulfobulbaceae bacterium]|nr:hypothetical protein [Desulfobulbaceae bacterium]
MPTKAFMITLCLFLLCCAEEAQARRIPAPATYGRVILKDFTKGSDFAAVVFDHWLHRAIYTCRLCHVDIGFAMKSRATGINAELNMQGYYCGSCHDGQREYKGREIFASCTDTYSDEDKKRCARCHSRGRKDARQYTFESFAKDFPRLAGGRAIDWEEAEEKKIINSIDYLEGISMKRTALKEPEDFSITSQASMASDVRFSHKKHAAWNGCALCHPDIFPSSKKGTVKYNMLQINRGQYCGLCHVNVAFSIVFCNKCHISPVR